MGDDKITPQSIKFGQYLHKLRTERNWSLRDIQEKTKGEVSNAYLSQLESGKKNVPTLKVIQRIADAFELPIEVFLNEAGYASPNIAAKKEASVIFRGYEQLSPKGRKVMSDMLKSLLESEGKGNK